MTSASRFRNNQTVVMLGSRNGCGCVVHFGRVLKDPTMSDVWLAEMHCEIPRPDHPDGSVWTVRAFYDLVLTLAEARSIINGRIQTALDQHEILNDPRLDDWMETGDED